MAVTINASTTAGLVQTADTTGNLSLQSNGTTIAALTSTGLAVTGAGTFSTTLGVTGAITSSQSITSATTIISTIGNSGTAFSATSATTGYIRGTIGNTSGDINYGVEGASANILATGTTAYDAVVRAKLGLSLAYADGTVGLRISNAGAVTIPGSLTVSTSVTATQNLSYGTSSMGFSNYNGAGTASSGAVSNWQLRADSVTGRSIAAGGTINASGADYAEYEPNDGLLISKGSIVGFKTNGALTLTFSEATRFGVKSTNPSYVGGDSWGGEDAVGARPTKTEDQTDEEFAAILASFEVALEIARVGVDRIAYSGKVPCNILGATPGDYIIAVDDSGVIGGVISTSPTFEQYKNAVGRVNKILPDGRAEIAVIIH